MKVVNYSDILNYELYENGVMQYSGVGVAGLGVGAFGMSTNKVCKEMKFIIRIKNEDSPQVVYNINYRKQILAKAKIIYCCRNNLAKRNPSSLN